MNAVIAAAPKDYSKLLQTITHLEKNVYPKIDKVYLLTPTKIDIKVNNIEIFNILETEVVKYDKYRLKYRPTWQYAMFLKLFQNVSETDQYLVLDSDHILVNRFDLFTNENKPYFFLTNDQNAVEYFNFNEKVFSLQRVYNHSFISEIMIIDKNIVDNMLSGIGCNRNNFFYEFEKYISRYCHLAEYELYGNYVYKHHPNLYSFKKINQTRLSYKWSAYEEKEVENLMNQFYNTDHSNIDSVRIDTYDPP